MSQASLFVRTRQEQILDQFVEFHAANPHVWRLFERFALRAAESRPRYSARAILHRVRWEVAIETTGGELKVNDHFSVYYGRLFIARYPDYASLFERRRLKSADRVESDIDGTPFLGLPSDRLEQTIAALLRDLR